MAGLDISTLGKTLTGLVAAGLWAYVRIAHVQGADDLVQACQFALVGLGVYHTTASGAKS